MTKKNITVISDEELDHKQDLSVEDPPEGLELGQEFWAKAELYSPHNKLVVTIRLDADIINFFKARRKGKKGYQTDINSVLRTFVSAQKPDPQHLEDPEVTS